MMLRPDMWTHDGPHSPSHPLRAHPATQESGAPQVPSWLPSIQQSPFQVSSTLKFSELRRFTLTTWALISQGPDSWVPSLIKECFIIRYKTLFKKLRMYQQPRQKKTLVLRTSLVFQCLRLCAPNAGNLGLTPGQWTRSSMPQRRVCMLQWRSKIPRTTTKTQSSQINNFKKTPCSHGAYILLEKYK